MSNVGFRGVVDWLVNGDVDDVAAHAGGNDEVAMALAGEHFTGVFGTINNAVDCSIISILAHLSVAR